MNEEPEKLYYCKQMKTAMTHDCGGGADCVSTYIREDLVSREAIGKAFEQVMAAYEKEISDLKDSLQVANMCKRDRDNEGAEIEASERESLFKQVAVAYLKPMAVQSEDSIKYFLDLAAKHTEALLLAAKKFSEGVE